MRNKEIKDCILYCISHYRNIPIYFKDIYNYTSVQKASVYCDITRDEILSILKELLYEGKIDFDIFENKIVFLLSKREEEY